jgi:hypothetical protein
LYFLNSTDTKSLFPECSQTREKKKRNHAGYWWLMPIILATCEADIRRSSVQRQPLANIQDPILKIPNTKQGWESGSNGKVPA